MARVNTVLIFGGSGGIGKAIAEGLTGHPPNGYNIIALSSKECDVSNLPECQWAATMYKPDIVINASGVNLDKPIHKLTAKEIEPMLQVNVLGAINIATACLPGMRDRNYGRIIYISSVLSTQQVFGTAVYSASKAFVDRFIKSVSAENIRCGITANSIQLGYFDAGMTHRLPYQDSFKERIGLKRWGRPQELVQCIEFIIANEYLTGTNIQLNGGICG